MARLPPGRSQRSRRLRRGSSWSRSWVSTASRMHQKAGDPRFLAWCDRLGLLVWAEMPAAYEFSPRNIHRLTREWLDVVERDRNHPVRDRLGAVQRELGRAEPAHVHGPAGPVLGLYHLTKALDPAPLDRMPTAE